MASKTFTPSERASSSQYLAAVEAELGAAWLPRIYRERIRTTRTRAYEMKAARRETEPQVQHTLLGIELKVGRRRMLCPDLATARYLAVFARIGAASVALPYDITRTSQLADELESSWHRMLLIADRIAARHTSAFRARFRRQLVVKVRAEIDDAGAGGRLPEFKRHTKQRS